MKDCERVRKAIANAKPGYIIRHCEIHGPTCPEFQCSGSKNDNKKIRMDLLPMDALLEIGKVLTFGAKKYGERNWEQGIDIQRFRGAILRHDAAYEMGEELDPESGLSHKTHKACSALMELALYLRGQK